MAQVNDFGLGPDEIMVRDTARSFLAEHTPVDKLRKLVARDHHEAYESAVQPAQWDEELWGKMVELGWTGLGVPEAHGGVGMKTVAVALLAEELGRAAVPSPLTTTLVATAALKAADAGKWLARVAEGTGASLATMSDVEVRRPSSTRARWTAATARSAGRGRRSSAVAASSSSKQAAPSRTAATASEDSLLQADSRVSSQNVASRTFG